MRAALLALALALGLAAPEAAAACSVCTTGTDGESAGVFLAMTIFMTTLPFAAVGGLVLFLRHRFKAREAERSASVGPERVAQPARSH